MMKFVGLAFAILLFYLTELNIAERPKYFNEIEHTATVKHCGDPGNCDRSQCNDTRATPPTECLEHIDEMECFRVCKDPKPLTDCLRMNPNQTAYCAILFQRRLMNASGLGGDFSLHIALPCSIKCRTDPSFWSCVHSCDEKGCFKAFKNCETKPRSSGDRRPWCDTSNETYLADPACRDCYVANLSTELITSNECTVRYSYTTSGNSDDEGINELSNSTSGKVDNNGSRTETKKEVSFSTVQPKCVYHRDIDDGRKPEVNETLPFELIVACLKIVNITFLDTIEVENKTEVEDIDNIDIDEDEDAGSTSTTPPPPPPTHSDLLAKVDFKKIEKGFLEKCVKLELAAYQISLCTGKGYYRACDMDGRSITCQQHCLHHLTKPYCYIPCPRNAKIQECENECARKWPQLKCECSEEKNRTSRVGNRTKFFSAPEERLKKFVENTKECPDHTCFLRHLYDLKPTPYDEDENDPDEDVWEDSLAKIRNCESFRHIQKFAPLLEEEYGYKNGAIFASDIMEMAEHYTLYECELRDCKDINENDLVHCLRQCFNKKRNEDEINRVCNGSESISNSDISDSSNTTAHYLRTEIFLWCLQTTFGRFYPNGRNRPTWSVSSFFKGLELNEYKMLVDCEKEARNPSGKKINASDFEKFAKILYFIEQDWCLDCTKETPTRPHKYDLDHVNCEIYDCFKKRVRDTCKPLKSVTTENKLILSTQCSWKIDFSLTREPYRLWSTYFDEISPHDETNHLQSPSTIKYLMKSVITFGKGHYVFPYFIIVRAVCDEGFYDETVYKFIASGATPVVKVTYIPFSSRAKNVNLMYSVFQGSLINLERHSESDKFYIPQNDLNRKVGTTDYDGITGCPLRICYPAYAIPQILLHVPIYDVAIYNQQDFTSVRNTVYTSTMHVRDVPGKGKLKIGNKTDPPTANLFFPKRRAQVYQDIQIVDLWARLPDSGYTGEDNHRPGPEIDHFEDENCEPFPDKDPSYVGGNPFSPLDTEDFFRLQYTHGNAPQLVIAGFYDPNLVIIGDPDMNKFELVRWGFETTGGTKEAPTHRLFQGQHKCFSHHYKFDGYIKPMYSLMDRLDPTYWLQFYRMRYAPKNYSDTAATKSIFDALALEDRIIFVTSAGLVSFYQNFNQTAMLGKAWEVEGGDKLGKCFKMVRIAKRSHPISDIIVGITFDYQVFNTTSNTTDDVSQQVWIGRYIGAGLPIEWEQITSGLSTQNLKEERVINSGGEQLGEVEPLPNEKLMDIPVERRETNPRSQIEAICYIVYRNKMGKASYIELNEDQGWCEAIDATPVVAVGSKIQVLVRMKAYYSGGTGNDRAKRTMHFYVVASINTDKAASLYSVWQIDAVIPRIPCLDEHTQSIPNVVQYNMEYFNKGDPAQVGTKYGCHEQVGNKKPQNQIFLHGMTYTRNFNLHMFLYGNKLLQSTDGGQTFVHLKSFPHRDNPIYRENCQGKTGDDASTFQQSKMAYHRIKLMAFDDRGHYAFLTSKRELWYGNLGSLTQIRLRPGPAASMTQTRLFEVREINDAVPFAVFFDSDNELVEMVAVVDENGTVSRIARRGINERTVLRARHFIEQFDKVGDVRLQKLAELADVVRGGNTQVSPVIDSKLTEEIRYDPVKWSVFCPFASPHFYHNFSETYARAQSYFIPPPRQHLDLGRVHGRSSLNTYQAVAFGLVWNSFFSDMYRAYSYIDVDPFITWQKKKATESVIGRLKFLNSDPKQYGVMVLPDKYRRFFTTLSDNHRIFQMYYMNYNVVVKITIEYSISNDYTLTPIDYRNHHLSAIHLNVDNSNGSLIQVNTEKEVIAAKAAVRYVIHMSVKKNTGLPQQYAGRNALVVPVYFHLIGGFGRCITTPSSGILGDSVATSIAVGCPPSNDLVFDWNSTVHSIKFRDVQAHYGGGKGDECYKGESFCFFARYPLVLHFHVFDESKQVHHSFSGKYIMRIVGGGYSRDTMKEYTTEEQQAFNVPGVSDVSLIWNEWDREQHQKREHQKDKTDKSTRNDSREIVLTAGSSAIKWACHTLSPCARISPRANFESVYFFKIFISNRGVDNDTLCLFEKEFIILLYGFPPSPELQLMTTVAFYVFVLALLYVVYLFFRSKKKLWKSTLLKVQGWLQIVRDTFPKSWAKEEEDLEETEEERQKRHDEIIMSLQGHLNVPTLIQKHTETEPEAETNEEHPVDEKQEKKSGKKKTEIDDKKSIGKHSHSSASSFKSGSSAGSQTPLLNPVTGRAGASTWTDMIYEQIISRRLASIIERNRRETEQIKKKVERGEKVKDK